MIRRACPRRRARRLLVFAGGYNGGILMRFSVLALASFALLAYGCGSSSNPATPSSGSLVTVQINNSVFSPNPISMKVGQQVNWKNNDTITHTATLDGMFNNVISP